MGKGANWGKIENQSGINNLEEISKYCDGIMVARGDLGVEINYDRLPVVQKDIIHKCLKLGKLAVTSTEMLESMIENPRPTRAEISDVANAIYDGLMAADQLKTLISRDFQNFSKGSSLIGETIQDAFIENKQQLSWGPDNDDPE